MKKRTTVLSIDSNMSKMFLSTLLSGVSAASALEPHASSVNFSPIPLPTDYYPPNLGTNFKVKYHPFPLISIFR